MNAQRALQGLSGGLMAVTLLAASYPFSFATHAVAQSAPALVEIPLRIAAGPPSAPMFAVAGIMASIVSNPPGGPPCAADRICGFPGLVGEARTTAGSMANLESLASGQSETAIVEGDLLWQAANGFGAFAGKPLGDLRALGVLYTESVLFVVRADSPFRSLADLRWGTVSMGAVDNPHLHTVHQILAGHSLRPRDLTQIHLSPQAAAEALAYGDIDAAIVVAPSLPAPFRTLAERTPLRLLPVAVDAAEALSSYYPYMLPVDIGDLAEGRERMPGIALAVLWVGTQQLPAPIAFAAVRSLMAPVNRESLAQALPASSAVAPDSELRRSPIALHPGAARYFEEASGVVR